MGNCFQKPVNNLSSTNNNPTPAIINSDDKKKEPKIGNRPSMATEPPSEPNTMTTNLKMFTFDELKTATENFRPYTPVGESGFGRVFRGWVDGETYAPSKAGVGIAVDVKTSNYKDIAHLKEWQDRLSYLEKFNHPNLVKLLGYCSKDGMFFLVCEYMMKGSLKNHLFKRGAKPLPWNTRIKIANEAAQGLAFLHTTEKTTIYKNFNSSNILLDKDFNAKLSDFGLVDLDPANNEYHVSTSMFGDYDFGLANLGPANGHYSTGVDTYYATPKYISTNDLYVKNDVYNFGVVLLEMITGLQLLDTNRPSSQYNLVEWARPALSNKKRLRTIIDPRLENDYPSKGASKASKLILSCLEANPKNRPSMEEVLGSLENIRATKAKPMGKRSK